MKQNLMELLRGNPYPGRGIVLGMTADDASSVIAYWIMGRSANSRNRIFTKTDDGIRTEARDPALLEDPSLIIYHPVRMAGQRVIVTNGDQTDTVRDFLARGETFEAALRTRAFEPDAPNFTPRISGLLERDGSYRLAICKASEGRGCQRQFFEYPAEGNLGHLLTTYQGDGNPLPSFAGEPVPVAMDAVGIDAFSAALWDALDHGNRISLFVRYIDLHTGLAQTRVRNQYGADWAEDTQAPIWK